MTDLLDNAGRIGAIIIDCLKAFSLVPHDWLLTKLVTSGMDLRVVVWIKRFLLICFQIVRVGGRMLE
jgi:hypothetical protein